MGRKGPPFPIAALILLGCAEPAMVTEHVSTSPVGTGQAGVVLRATVDGITGTMRFESLTGSDVRLNGIYGHQGVTVQLFNSPVRIDTLLGRKTFSADVGVRNLLPFPVGDEQAGPIPLATMGVHVFVTTGPTVTGTTGPCAPSPCTVTTQNHHGTTAFNALNQRYWHWEERLGARGSGSDSSSRQTWIFEASPQVTAFQFEVLVSAAWPAPFDRRWRLQYDGDSIPDLGAEPRWGVTNTSATRLATQGVMNITTLAGGEMEFYRLDSLAPSVNAYAEARVRFNSADSRARAVIHFQDGAKFLALGISSGTIGFLAAATGFPYLASWSVTTNTFRTYQLRKYAADSVVAYVDLQRVGSFPYASLTIPLGPILGTRFQFGSPDVGVVSNADWDYVIFEIGAAHP